MEQEKTAQQIAQERFSELPEIIQDAIKDSKWVNELRKIIEDAGLLLDQGLEVENETFMLLLGLTGPKDYTKNIKREAKLDNDQAVEIAEQVEEKILSPIKKAIIEASEKEVGIERNMTREILGEDPEIDNILPKIDTNLEGEKASEESDEIERQNLIQELQQDIEIEEHEDNDLEEINEQEKQWIEESKNQVPNNLPTSQSEIKENQIPFREDNSPNPRMIDADFSKQPDNLPGLEPLRTLQSDSENKDDIVSSKLGGAHVKRPENTDVSSEEPQKPVGPDPYRETIE